MGQWATTRATRVLRALRRIGWRVKRTRGSHKILGREGWRDVIFAFHDRAEIGPPMLAELAKVTGLTPDDI